MPTRQCHHSAFLWSNPLCSWRKASLAFLGAAASERDLPTSLMRHGLGVEIVDLLDGWIAHECFSLNYQIPCALARGRSNIAAAACRARNLGTLTIF